MFLIVFCASVFMICDNFLKLQNILKVHWVVLNTNLLYIYETLNKYVPKAVGEYYKYFTIYAKQKVTTYYIKIKRKMAIDNI